MSSLDDRAAALAARDLPLAAEILREVIRIPADHVDRPPEDGGDPECGLSNHEGPRLEYLRTKIVEVGAVRDHGDVSFDEYGSLVWEVYDPDDEIPPDQKKVVHLDGHADTVRALRDEWIRKIGGGIDAYLGLVDPRRVDRGFLRAELGHLPPDAEWEHLLFGRGAADQLGGVVAQVVASRILLELAPEGALRGVRVRSYATVSEEDNDGGGPRYLVRDVFPGAGPGILPDVVVLTEGTGDSRAGGGALGIYRGQRGRMQIEVEVVGRSCHGSMPREGLNPLEFGAAIVAEAADRARDGFAAHPFLGKGTRTASDAHLRTPSDCAVPERFRFRLDRRLTAGETPEAALGEVETLESVARARRAGLRVEVRVPTYDAPTWRGYVLGNEQVYPGWVTPEDHPAIAAAVATYRGALGPAIAAHRREHPESPLREEPRVGRWIFSTDGVGFPVRREGSGIAVPESKGWIDAGGLLYPPMFGIGPGFEQNTHKIGECVDERELGHAIAFLARFPSVFAGG